MVNVIVKGKIKKVKRNKLKLMGMGITDISQIEGLENLTNLSTLSLDNNKFTDIKGLESPTSLIEITLGLVRKKKLGIISGFNLNGKIIPRNIARKMGIRHSPGDAISRASVYIRAKKMVKYCQFVKNTGNVDCTTPGIVDVYNQWKKYH